MSKRYWDGTGRYQALAAQLHALLPPAGPVTAPNSAKLNAFRAAANAYYDIFNNGGCNRRGEIREIFGWRVDHLLGIEDEETDFEAIFRYTEGRMDRRILAAAKEQGLA